MTELPGLRIRDLTVRYGGILAVDQVDLDVPAGTITGLIGPNGAGKSSLFSACSGEVPAAGSIVLFGRDISHMSPVRRARAGIGRTFQRIQLFRTLTVRENVAMGHEAAYVRKHPWSLVRALPSERRETNRVTDEVLDHCGLSDIQDSVAGSLSTGQQRMVELARVLASPAQMLLLDEPSSGLSSQEGTRFAAILREATKASGRGILLVEHDMDLVTAVCETVHVLNFGRLIFAGSTADALGSDEVRQSYLGVAADADGHGAYQTDVADA
jgi:ABC-type branched-subunit amino acid transport system ATPase component